MNDQIKIQLCRDDFYLMMRNAVLKAGGGDRLEEWKRMKFEDIVNTFAQNGLRITYIPEKHMNAVKIVWGEENSAPSGMMNPHPNLGRRESGSLPKKKQLLCDSMDKGEDDLDWTKDDVGG